MTLITLLLCCWAVQGVYTANSSDVVPMLLGKIPVDNLIVHGDDVDVPGKWPWQCSMQYISNSFHFCGCSYYTDLWVLTAAHCVVNKNPSQIKIVFGAHDLFTQQQGKPVAVDVAEFIPHPRYGMGRGFAPNDIALVRLVKTPELNSFVQEGLLPTGSVSRVRWHRTKRPFTCFITGWGRDENGQSPNVLQEAKINIMHRRECRSIWGKDDVNNRHICVCDCDSKAAGAWSGDSGGPLQCLYRKKWYVLGLTSWGPSSGSAQYPSVYTQVSSFIGWIEDTSGVTQEE